MTASNTKDLFPVDEEEPLTGWLMGGIVGALGGLMTGLTALRIVGSGDASGVIVAFASVPIGTVLGVAVGTHVTSSARADPSRE